MLVSVCLFCLACALLSRSHANPLQHPLPEQGRFGAALAGQMNPEQEALSHEMARQLAQALYTQQQHDVGGFGGHRRARVRRMSPLQRRLFRNTNVTCNDGSVAGFYIQRNYHSRRWVIFLEGGWICYDVKSCTQRATREHFRVTSDLWPLNRTGRGILSTDPTENPYLHDANHVFVPYCSSDSWSGTRRGSPNNPNVPAFMGHLIVREVIRELADTEQLLQHEDVILAGASAGGIGVLLNVDVVSDLLAPAGVQVRGLVDSAWFMDHDPFSSACADGSGRTCSVLADVRKGVKLWRAKVPATCAEKYPTEIWHCYLGYKIFPTIRTPLFIFQWQFDKFQLYADNVAMPASPDQWHYIHQKGSLLRQTFNNLSAIFSPACIEHEVVNKAHWRSVTVQGVALPDALECWVQGLPKRDDDQRLILGKDLEVRAQVAERFLKEDMKDLGSVDDLVVPTPYYSGSASMLADAPRSYKLASNLIRSIQTSHNDREDSERNTVPRRNRNRSRGRHSKKAFRSRARCLTEYNSCGGGAQAHEDPDNMSHSDLVRSLDRRSSVTKSSERKLDSKERKRERRRRRKQRKREKQRERKQRQKRLRALRRKERRRERRRLKKEEKKRQQRQQRQQEQHGVLRSATAAPKKKSHHLQARSVLSEPMPSQPNRRRASQCRTKLVDTCTWPHCNPSCPKLKNPETGQEIDFLSLLKSFGLNLQSVATALGVDINTLNGMDRDVLLHMLTAQSGRDH